MSIVKSTRTTNYFTQLKGSLIYKLLAILISFLLYPVMINYLGPERFGVWVTMYTLVSWVSFFDLGIGNGLRNKLTIALSDGNRKHALKLISSAYTFLSILILVCMFSFAILSLLVPWGRVFNTRVISESELTLSVVILGLAILLNFVLALVAQLLHAVQKTSIVVMGQALTHVFALGFILIIGTFSNANLLLFSLVYSLAILSSSLILNRVFFAKNIDLIPRKKYFNKRYLKELMTLGAQFLIIQLAVIILFTTDKFIIIQILGPTMVAEYDVVSRMFSVILIISATIVTPLWSAYTNAYSKKDISWIKITLNKSHLLVLLSSLFAILLYFFGQKLIDIWIGSELIIDQSLIALFGFFVVMKVWTDIYSHFLNGTGHIRLQMYLAIIQVIINVPLSIFLGSLYGMNGVVLGTIISLCLSAIGLPLRSAMLLNQLEKEIP